MMHFQASLGTSKGQYTHVVHALHILGSNQYRTKSDWRNKVFRGTRQYTVHYAFIDTHLTLFVCNINTINMSVLVVIYVHFIVK